MEILKKQKGAKATNPTVFTVLKPVTTTQEVEITLEDLQTQVADKRDQVARAKANYEKLQLQLEEDEALLNQLTAYGN